MAQRLKDEIAEQRKLESSMSVGFDDPTADDPALHPHRAYTAVPAATGMTDLEMDDFMSTLRNASATPGGRRESGTYRAPGSHRTTPDWHTPVPGRVSL